MTTASSTAMTFPPYLGFWDKLLIYAACALAGAIFITVGWIAVEPVDPMGPVSLLTGRGAVSMLVQVCAIAAVVAALATVIAGRRLPDAGTFAAALGLAIVTLRGGTMEYVLIQSVERGGGSHRVLSLELFFEAIGWFVAIAVSALVSGLVMRWVHGAPARGSDHVADGYEPLLLSAWDAPGLSGLLGAGNATGATHPRDGIKHTLIAALVTVVMFRVLATGLHERRIDHGQVCFVIAASICLGCSAACYAAPVRSALWSMLAVPLLAAVGYMVAAVTTGSPSLTAPNIPASHFLRALPIQYIAVGTVAAIATFWWQRGPRHITEVDAHAAS